jgi:hypothetical protein
MKSPESIFESNFAHGATLEGVDTVAVSDFTTNSFLLRLTIRGECDPGSSTAQAREALKSLKRIVETALDGLSYGRPLVGVCCEEDTVLA